LVPIRNSKPQRRRIGSRILPNVPTCKSAQTNVCRQLDPNSNVLSELPEALQLRDGERATIHLANVSPLELCKLTGTTFTLEPPSAALQAAVTAIMGIAPFGTQRDSMEGIAKFN